MMKLIKDWLVKRRQNRLKEEFIHNLNKLSGRERLDQALRYAEKYPELDIPTAPFDVWRK